MNFLIILILVLIYKELKAEIIKNRNAIHAVNGERLNDHDI